MILYKVGGEERSVRGSKLAHDIVKRKMMVIKMALRRVTRATIFFANI